MVKKQRGPSDTYAAYISDSQAQDPHSSDEEADEPVPSAPAASVTAERLAGVKAKLAEGSLSAVRTVLAMYRMACRVNEGPTAAVFADSKTFNEVIMYTLDAIPGVLRKKIGKRGKNSKHWAKYSSVLRNFLACTIALLKQVAQAELIKYVYSKLKRAGKLIPLFEAYCRKLCKQAAAHWAQGDKGVTLVCYDFLRVLLACEGVEKLEVLKRLFVSYAMNAKFVTWDNYPHLDLMRTCYIDLLGCDLSAAYQVVFLHLRQLTLHLTTVTKSPAKDSIKTLVTWQYLNSLCLLGQAVTRHFQDLEKMMYPLVQVTLGLLKLANSFYQTPFRLHLLRLLVSLEARARIFIPGVSAYILEILAAPELKKKAWPAGAKTFEFYAAIKVSKGDAVLDLFKQQLVEETCDVLVEHAAAWGRAPAFPELCAPLRLVISKHAKTVKSPAVRGKLLSVLKQLEDASKWVEARRKTAPTEGVTEVEGQSPLEMLRDRVLKTRKEVIEAKCMETSEMKAS